MNKYSILIVDDEKEICELIKGILEFAGYSKVDYCVDSKEAFEKIKKNKFHIVLTDIVMPGFDGVELLKKIKEIDPLVQVIMMTGYSTIDKTVSCLELGANDYMLKPFNNNDEVVEIVEYSVKKLERWRTSIRGILK